MKRKRKLSKHIRKCIWFRDNIIRLRQYGSKSKTYYFRKQIEVAENLLKTLK
jgi:hypothetical protein